MNFVVDDIGKIVQAMRNNGVFAPYDVASVLTPYYMFGHRQEISNRLLAMNNDPGKKTKKYPMVALRLDFQEDVSQAMWRSTLNIIIVAYTKPNYNAEERYVNVFKPILYPLYESFLKQLNFSGLFSWDQKLEEIYPPHTKVDRPYWGTPSAEANLANIFNDPLDAVEILNLKLNQRLKCSA